MTQDMSVADARAKAIAATDKAREVHSGYRAALDALESHWRPLLRDARSASDAATSDLSKAIAAATADHELSGRKVYFMEPQTQRYTGKTIGHKRIDGIIETYRPGVDLGRGYSKASCLKAGDPFVRLLLKSGKPGTSTREYAPYFGGETKWLFAESAS